jgi:RNA polymerase sigma factor (sigma-70 family)
LKALLSDGVSDGSGVNGLAERAFRLHYRDVFRFVRRRTATQHEAEEVTQAVFAQAAERLEASRDSVALRGWLYTVARRRLVDEARRRSRSGSVVSLDGFALPVRERRYGGEVSETLRRALEQLPASHLSVVVGRLIEGRSFAELAAALGVSEAACKMRFLRGLASVRAVFEEEGLEP